MTDPFSMVDAAARALGVGPGMAALLTIATAAAIGRAMTQLMAGKPLSAAGTGVSGVVFVVVLYSFASVTAVYTGG